MKKRVENWMEYHTNKLQILFHIMYILYKYFIRLDIYLVSHHFEEEEILCKHYVFILIYHAKIEIRKKYSIFFIQNHTRQKQYQHVLSVLFVINQIWQVTLDGLLYKHCTNISQILGKYFANIGQILGKYQANIGQILREYYYMEHTGQYVAI